MKKAIIFYPNGRVEVKLVWFGNKFKEGAYEYICSIPAGDKTYVFFCNNPMSVIPKVNIDQQLIDFGWLNLETQVNEYLHKLFVGGYQNSIILVLTMVLIFTVILIYLGIL